MHFLNYRYVRPLLSFMKVHIKMCINVKKYIYILKIVTFSVQIKNLFSSISINFCKININTCSNDNIYIHLLTFIYVFYRNFHSGLLIEHP